MERLSFRGSYEASTFSWVECLTWEHVSVTNTPLMGKAAFGCIWRIRALPIFLQVFSQPILTPEDFHGWTEKNHL